MSCSPCVRSTLRHSPTSLILTDFYQAFGALCTSKVVCTATVIPGATRPIHLPKHSKLRSVALHTTTRSFSSPSQYQKSNGGVLEISDATIDALAAEVAATSQASEHSSEWKALETDEHRDGTRNSGSHSSDQPHARNNPFSRARRPMNHVNERDPLPRRERHNGPWRSLRLGTQDLRDPAENTVTAKQSSGHDAPSKSDATANSRNYSSQERHIPIQKDREYWQIQKAALKAKFGDQPWNPRKRLSPDALAGIRAIHAQFPDEYTTPVLAAQFEVSPEVIRRILKSKWRPDSEEEIDRQSRWFKRGETIWKGLAEKGYKAPAKWRAAGVGRPRPEYTKPAHRRKFAAPDDESGEENSAEKAVPEPSPRKVTRTAPKVFVTTKNAEPEEDLRGDHAWV